jgi:HEAT repeat protein
MLPALLQVLTSPSQRSLRSLLGQLPDLSSHFVRGVNSADVVVRASAVELLGDRRDSKTAPWVRDALKDASATVKRAAVIAAGRLRDQAAVPSLCDLLIASDEQSVPAAEALGEIGDPRATAALCRALEDAEPRLRWSAVKALRKLADPVSVGPLGLALSDVDGDVANGAAAALGDIPDARSASLLLSALPFPDPTFRATVLSALGRLNDVKALPALILGLKDGSAVVRRAAAEGLLALAELAEAAPLRFRKVIVPLDQTARANPRDPELRLLCRRAAARIEELTVGVKDLPLPSSPMELGTANLPRIAERGGPAEPVIQRITGKKE